ncbi:MAG: PDZ domain-containing protein [bacterium]|nr:PDZ domain-containing protein [bacterium]
MPTVRSSCKQIRAVLTSNLKPLAILLLLLTTNFARADIVTIEVTINSVDEEARTIKATRKGKSLELDVSRKASVTIKGKKATLAKVAAGQTAKIDYESTLEVVTKIDVTNIGDSNVVFTGLTVSIGEDGKCKLLVDSRESPPVLGKPTGTQVAVPIFGSSPVAKLRDGRLHVASDFSKIDDASGLKAEFIPEAAKKAFDEQVSVDDGLLVLSSTEGKRATVVLPRALQTPCDVKLQLAGHRDGNVLLQFGLGDKTLVVGLHGVNSPDADAGSVVASIRKGKGKFEQLVRVKHPAFESQEYEFQIDGATATQRTMVSLGAVSDFPVAIRRLDVTAKFPPSFGIQFTQRGNRILVKRTVDGGAGANAGVKPGDVLVEIDGEATRGLKEVMELLATKVIGAEVSLAVERFGNRKMLKITPQ